MKFCYNTNFTLSKQSQRSISVLQDGSRSLGLFWKEKIPSYNRRNTVHYLQSHLHEAVSSRSTLFSSLSVISGLWEDDNERLCAVEPFKDKYSLLYRTHPQSLLVSWPCYVMNDVRLGFSFR